MCEVREKGVGRESQVEGDGERERETKGRKEEMKRLVWLSFFLLVLVAMKYSSQVFFFCIHVFGRLESL